MTSQCPEPSLTAAVLRAEVLNGEVLLDRGITADLVGEHGKFASIYGWSSAHPGQGNTRAALAALKEYGGGHLDVHDPGEPDSRSYGYWRKMVREGLVSQVFDGESQDITSDLSAPDPKRAVHP